MTDNAQPCREPHRLAVADQSRNARRTRLVLILTLIMMVAEIAAGWMYGSMALLADGWHMATHVVALSIAGVAYVLARRWSQDDRFAFGTWKIEILGAFTSALLLGVVAAALAFESILRLVSPEEVQFGPALVVAVIGLAVNLASALLLQGHDHSHAHVPSDHDHNHGPGHDHGHEPSHDHGHDHAPAAADATQAAADMNMQSAYAHVLSDAFTSVLAILALSAGLWLGWTWLDPVMGLVGAGVIAWWAKGLLADSARVLVDREMDSPVVAQIRRAIESDDDAQIADLHVWRVGRAAYAAVVTVVADRPLTPERYRERVARIPALAHVSVEVNRCPRGDC